MATPGQVFDFKTNGSDIVDHLIKIDSFTDVGYGGILGILFLIVIGGSLFFTMRNKGNERAMPVSLFITSIIGLFLRLMGLIGDNVFWVCTALFIVSVILLIREQGQFET